MASCLGFKFGLQVDWVGHGTGGVRWEWDRGSALGMGQDCELVPVRLPGLDLPWGSGTRNKE